MSNRGSGMKKLNAVIWFCAVVLMGLILFTSFVLVGQLTQSMFNELETIFLVPINPEFSIGDENGRWQSGESLGIFSASYDGESGSAVISSSNGDAIFAPGSSVHYTFKVQNTGNAAIDYDILIDFAFLKNNEDFGIENSPLLVRLFKRDANTYIVGDKDTLVPVYELGEYHDIGVLGINSYNEYDLEIHWLFDSGNDDHDMWLAGLSATESIHFAVDLTTIATQNPDIHAKGGIVDPVGTPTKAAGSANPFPLVVLGVLMVGYAGTLIAGAMVKKNKLSGKAPVSSPENDSPAE